MVRTVAKNSLGVIAVPTENLQIVRKAETNEFLVPFVTIDLESRALAFSTRIGIAVVIYVIDRQKRGMSFCAADALPAVGSENDRSFLFFVSAAPIVHVFTIQLILQANIGAAILLTFLTQESIWTTRLSALAALSFAASALSPFFASIGAALTRLSIWTRITAASTAFNSITHHLIIGE